MTLIADDCGKITRSNVLCSISPLNSVPIAKKLLHLRNWLYTTNLAIEVSSLTLVSVGIDSLTCPMILCLMTKSRFVTLSIQPARGVTSCWSKWLKFQKAQPRILKGPGVELLLTVTRSWPPPVRYCGEFRRDSALRGVHTAPPQACCTQAGPV